MVHAGRRVVISGLGVVSSIGKTVADAWSSLENGTSGVSEIEGHETAKLNFSRGGQINDFDPYQTLEHREITQMDRFSQMAVVAAQEALADAGLSDELADPGTGIILGTASGGQETLDDGFQNIYGKNKARLNPLTVARFMPNAAASHVSMKFGVTGPSFTICTACSSSNHAIGQAFHAIRAGDLDRAVTGGSDCPFSWGHMIGWSSMHVVAPDLCRPFDTNRNGMVLGEGAGILVLELETAARARGAIIYGEVVGFGMSADAGSIMQPSAEGAARAIRGALNDGHVEPDRVSYINAHGTGTRANDPAESTAIRSVLGDAADRAAVSSTKPAHGHGLGAAGAFEAIVSCLATSRGVLPATLNCEDIDPECDLDVITGDAREAEVDVVLSNSFAFGGLNAVLAFQRYG
ncbi:MAG: beta-ketoacyl-[acyl-carrier-protein] synthase family protein [Gammaproteobacteria bacterium]|nr:beta-ketoacyl-[acyl-carrier-protein] synthase family protein [Gammaproteobacteria bacterium]